jgi:predicted Zn-dependent protease with MMP-like domain
MHRQQIIMNYTVPPGPDDIEAMANAALETMPDEILRHCEGLAIRLEEFPDEATEEELELEDTYELLALYRSGREISPGVQKKFANNNDVLILYRRPILDVWCETAEDLPLVIRNVILEELARNFEFSDDEIEEMGKRHYQGML